jgi:hypothetical protein
VAVERDRIIEAVIPALISVALALQWLIYNYRLFGSVMPISGISESLNHRFGEGLIFISTALLENVLIVGPLR